jgi:hypothetical protein
LRHSLQSPPRSSQSPPRSSQSPLPHSPLSTTITSPSPSPLPKRQCFEH